MKRGLNIAFFGSSLVSAYWNGAATYYRGVVRALHERGHHVTFYESDAYQRQQHRDIDDPTWAKVVVYSAEGMHGVNAALESARNADIVVKASGVGVFDEYLEKSVLEIKGPNALAIFWDVDAPATLDRISQNPSDQFRQLIPRYDMILTYGGGDPVSNAYKSFGAKQCIPIYNGLDPSTHFPVKPDMRFAGDLGFLGNRLPDREARVEEFFLRAATLCPNHQFVLGGNGWQDKKVPSNVKYLGHIYTADHNSFNCTAKAVLNISRQSMASYGFSPATRVFEAAGAAACMITDYWEGIDFFFEPGKEILVAHNAEEVAETLRGLSSKQALNIGSAAFRRARAQHTYYRRVEELERVLNISGSISGNTSSSPLKKIASHAQSKKSDSLKIVILGLSITSSWGNGHATTYRGLVRELCARGHDVLFLERVKPWYAANRDLPKPPYGSTRLYNSLDELKQNAEAVRAADLVIVGSYVPDGIAVSKWVHENARGITAFYDIDTPVTVSKLERGEFEYISPELIPLFDLYISFTGGPMLRRLEREFRAQSARALYCSVDPALYTPKSQPRKWQLGYLGTYSDDRQPTLERLLMEPARQSPATRMIVAGPQYPKSIQWPENIKRIQHLPPSAHSAFYNSLKLTLNITRQDMINAGHSPSVRLFEAAACGVPIISDYWDGLDEFFEVGEEILIAHQTSDVLKFMELSDGECERIGKRARERVLESHTAAHRAAELEEYALELLNRNRQKIEILPHIERSQAAGS